jgi:hypothetical protein
MQNAQHSNATAHCHMGKVARFDLNGSCLGIDVSPSAYVLVRLSIYQPPAVKQLGAADFYTDLLGVIPGKPTSSYSVIAALSILHNSKPMGALTSSMAGDRVGAAINSVLRNAKVIPSFSVRHNPLVGAGTRRPTRQHMERLDPLGATRYGHAV